MKIHSEESKEKPISKRAIALIAITLALGLALMLAGSLRGQEQSRRTETLLARGDEVAPVIESIEEVPALLKAAQIKKTEPTSTQVETASLAQTPTNSLEKNANRFQKEETIPKVYDIDLEGELQEYVITKAKKASVDPELVLAVMSVESSYRNIVSDDGQDFGLMQINKVNHKWLSEGYGITDIMDPKQNIDAGIVFLAEYNKKYDELYKILMSYNCGESRAKELWGLGLKDTNVGYVKKVKKALKSLKKLDVSC